MVVAHSSKFYTVSTVLFHKYKGDNVGVTTYFSLFYVSVHTISNVKFYGVNKGYVQVIGIILCQFPHCPIIYPVGPVYHYIGHP